ncbi:U2 snRNP-associated SURP motif-containing protein-like [Babylonia areolata]|uniref:U2 snRNP-associated SURP motif-containing protein-like n=1 Tax=Babylonia areolata TaxID=304850 RepID=UPI003FD69881
MADRKLGGKAKEPTIKSFELGAPRKGMTKREQEELKKKRDEEATAAVYEEFLASFEDAQKGGLAKTWVKGGVVNPGDKSQESVAGKDEKSRLYRPTTKLGDPGMRRETKEEKKERRERERESRFEPPSFPTTGSSSKKKKDEKKKSNLELFKEELKLIQEERQERHKLKKAIRDSDPSVPVNIPVPEPRPARQGFDFLDMSIPFSKGSVPADPGDESTTNIYVGNINPKMTETQLCEVFGKYGPLASVKIMWPRTEEERSRGRNCGFVAFMNRKDGERALNALRGKDIQGFEMKLGWGKAVPIPPHPVYIPPALAELTQPPPPSGLPFNAQPQRKKRDRDRDKADKTYGSVPPPGQADRDKDREEKQTDKKEEEPEDMEKTLAKAVVKVTIPTERAQLHMIHRMIEFVVREGPMFEAMIMNRELHNPQFRFLFDNQSANHLYYRWKLFSILQGDSPYKWRTEEFRMFKGGSMWRPPPINPYTQGMPEELVDKEVEFDHNLPLFGGKKGSLTDSQRDRLEDMLRSLTPERTKVGEVMIWCLDHAEAAEEIVECISEALSILQTPLPKKIARLYLVSDILYNSSAKVPNASFFRKCFQMKLKDIFKDVNETYNGIEGRLKAEQFKQRVMACFRAWEDWAIYPLDFLINLQNIFLGLVPSKQAAKEAESPEEEQAKSPEAAFLDGTPIEDLDGAPLEAPPPPPPPPPPVEVKPPPAEDLDGEDLGEDLDGMPLNQEAKPEEPKPVPVPLPTFTRSKWETVDEAELEAQAMTTSKWDTLEQESDGEKDNGVQGVDEDIDGAPMEEAAPAAPAASESSESEDGGTSQRQEMTEERRAKLREIEMKVVKYQDDIETGRRSRKSQMSIAEQVAHYRKKLLNKEKNNEGVDSPGSSVRESRKHQRSRSPATPRNRSVSPKRAKKNKSPKRSKRSRSRSPRGRSPHSRKRHRKHRD